VWHAGFSRVKVRTKNGGEWLVSLPLSFFFFFFLSWLVSLSLSLSLSLNSHLVFGDADPEFARRFFSAAAAAARQMSSARWAVRSFSKFK
jgi:hypothetical protein